MKKWFYSFALKFVLKQHQKWLTSKGVNGIRLTLDRADLSKASFRQTMLLSADLYRAYLSGSDIREAEADLCKFSMSSFTRSEFYKCRFSSANMDSSYFGAASLKCTIFEEADFTAADLSTARLRKVKLNIHINNRQKEDLADIIRKAEKLNSTTDLFINIGAVEDLIQEILSKKRQTRGTSAENN